jgi:hypothetical protein
MAVVEQRTFLIYVGASPNLRTASGNTLLAVACGDRALWPTARALVARGADVTAKYRDFAGGERSLAWYVLDVLADGDADAELRTEDEALLAVLAGDVR